MTSRPLRTALLSLALGAVTALPAAAMDAEPCPDLDSGRVETSGSPMAVTVDAPVGHVIMSYCVGASAGGAPELIAVDPGVATLLLSHPSGHPVTHWSATYGSIPVATDDTPAEAWWPAPPSPDAGVQPSAPAPVESAPSPEPAVSAPVAAPRDGSPAEASPADARPAPGASPAEASPAGARPTPGAAVITPGGPSESEVTASSNAAPSRTTLSSVGGSGTVSTAVVASAAALPTTATSPGLVDRLSVPSTEPSGALTAAQLGGATTGARATRERGDTARASAVAPVSSEVRHAGFSGDGQLGASVAALLMLGLFGSTAAVLHLARREPAPH